MPKKHQVEYTDPLTLQRIDIEIDVSDSPKLIVETDVVLTEEEFQRMYIWVEEWNTNRLNENN